MNIDGDDWRAFEHDGYPLNVGLSVRMIPEVGLSIEGNLYRFDEMKTVKSDRIESIFGWYLSR